MAHLKERVEVLPNLQGAGDGENAGGACGKSYAMVDSYIRK